MQQLKIALNLKLELDKLRPISKEREGKIMQKFRLDWNYHSNHLEGNSLTFGETRMLILHGITAQGKPPTQDGVCNPVLTFSPNSNKEMNMWTGLQTVAGRDLQSRPHVQSKLKQVNEHVDWVTNPVQRRLWLANFCRQI